MREQLELNVVVDARAGAGDFAHDEVSVERCVMPLLLAARLGSRNSFFIHCYAADARRNCDLVAAMRKRRARDASRRRHRRQGGKRAFWLPPSMVLTAGVHRSAKPRVSVSTRGWTTWCVPPPRRMPASVQSKRKIREKRKVIGHLQIRRDRVVRRLIDRRATASIDQSPPTGP